MDRIIRLPLSEKIRTARLLMQRLRYEDAAEIFYGYASKDVVTKYLSFPTSQSIYETGRFLAHTQQGWEAGTDYSMSIRLNESNRMIGSFGILNDHGRVQIGYALSPTYWGQGFATEACTAVTNLLERTPGITELWTFIDAENTASAKVLEKSGWTLQERREKWFAFVNQGDDRKDCFIYKR